MNVRTIGSSIQPSCVTNLSWNCVDVSSFTVSYLLTGTSHGLVLYSGTAESCEAYMPIGHDHISVSAPYPHLLGLLKEICRMPTQKTAGAGNIG